MPPDINLGEIQQLLGAKELEILKLSKWVLQLQKELEEEKKRVNRG